LVAPSYKGAPHMTNVNQRSINTRPPLPAMMTITGSLINGNGILTPTIPSAGWQHGQRFVVANNTK
jgi:hypothetical protein